MLFPGDFVHTLGDAHVYSNHVEALKIQLEREPMEFPKIVIKRQVEKIEDFNIDDFEVVGYKSHPKIVMDMAVWSLLLKDMWYEYAVQNKNSSVFLYVPYISEVIFPKPI